MPLPSDESCATCRYFHIYQSEEEGRCYRNPPQVTGRAVSEFPTVKGFDWCGEYFGIPAE